MEAVRVVRQLRALAAEPGNRAAIVQDRSCLAGLILFLTHQDVAVIEDALQAIHYLCGNTHHCEIMRNELGMMISLENIRNRSELDKRIKELAQSVYTLLSAPVQMQTPEQKDRKNKTQFFIVSTNKRAKTITLHIHGLDNLERKSLCEEALLKVKGVISFTFHVAIRRCTVRVKPELATECITSAIAETNVLKVQQVIQNESGNEVYLPIKNSNIIIENNQCLPDYLPEEESPQKDLEKAIARPASKGEHGANWLNAAANFLSKTFYW
ncbi:armadillo repeat-containing protein 1-like [Gastrophryne carolinensis]